MGVKALKTVLVLGITAAAVMLLGVAGTFVAFNKAASTSDFLFGPLLLLLTALAIGGWILAAHHTTGTAGGTVIGIITTMLIVAVVVLWKPFEGVQWRSVFYGLGTGTALLVASTAMIYGAARYYHHNR